MNPLGKTSDQILSHAISDHLKGSDWHFFQMRSWLDLAKRTQQPSAIHLAAFDLRYGIEYLLFELLVMSSEAITEAEYQKCIGDPHQMKKMLGEHAANYEKLAHFSKMVTSLSAPDFKAHTWDIRALFATWGVASSYLHFVGIHQEKQQRVEWVVQSIACLEAGLDPIWKAITETHGLAIMRPSKMSPDVKKAWDEFAAGTISLEDALLRLKLRFPQAWISGTLFKGA